MKLRMIFGNPGWLALTLVMALTVLTLVATAVHADTAEVGEVAVNSLIP